MVKPIEVLEEKPISMAEVRKHLEGIRKAEGELNFRANKAEEYLNDFTILSPQKAKDLTKKLKGLKITRLKEDMITKTIDLMPKTLDDLKVILSGYTLSITKKDMEQIISVVQEFQ